jgi:hypothetical protein
MDFIVLYPTGHRDRSLGVELSNQQGMLVLFTYPNGEYRAVYDCPKLPFGRWHVIAAETESLLAAETWGWHNAYHKETPTLESLHRWRLNEIRSGTRWQDTYLGVGRPPGTLDLVVGQLDPGGNWNSELPRIMPMARGASKETPRERPSTSKPAPTRAKDFDSTYAKYRNEKLTIESMNRYFNNWRPPG